MIMARPLALLALSSVALVSRQKEADMLELQRQRMLIAPGNWITRWLSVLAGMLALRNGASVAGLAKGSEILGRALGTRLCRNQFADDRVAVHL